MKKRNLVIIALGLILALLYTGCSKEEETIKIGAVYAVTGGASFLGAPEAKTAEMLVEEINSAGGIDGKKIELIVKDTRCQS